MWNKLKAACGHSLTVAVSYVFLGLSVVLEFVDTVAVFVTDQDINALLSQMLGTDSKMLGRYMAGVSLITLVARTRSLWKTTHA